MSKDNGERKIKVRDAIKDYCLETHSRDFDKDLSDHKRSRVFLEFYVNKIHNKTRTEISEDEFELGYVDGANDLKIDFIHKVDDSVLIIQSKFRAAGKIEEDSSISTFKNCLNTIVSGRFKPNKELQEVLDTVDLSNDKFRLVFITMGKISGQAEIEATIEPVFNEVLGDIKDRFEIEFLDENKLNEEYRNALSLSSTANNSTHILYPIKNSDGEKSEIIDLEIGGRRQCVLTVSGNNIINIYEKEKDSLFSLNIRNFIGNSSFNKGISKTAINKPNDFYFFNNGISCLASQINVNKDLDQISVTGIQVINGAQTVKTLFNVKRTNKEKLAEITLLVRITEIDEAYRGGEKTFIEEITQYNNSQNAIKNSDFRSNDPIQIDLERHFDELKKVELKTIKYVRKRTLSFSSTKYITVKFEDFAKVIHAFLWDPISFSSSIKYLFGTEANEGYTKVFGDGNKVFEFFSKDEFKLNASIWWLGNGILDRIKEDNEIFKEDIKNPSLDDKKKKDIQIMQRALQGKWFVIYAARLLLERNFPDDFKLLISKYYKQPWKYESKKIKDWYEDLYKLSRDVVVELYVSDMTKPNFLHRNWLREHSTQLELERKCRFAPRLDLKNIFNEGND